MSRDAVAPLPKPAGDVSPSAAKRSLPHEERKVPPRLNANGDVGCATQSLDRRGLRQGDDLVGGGGEHEDRRVDVRQSGEAAKRRFIRICPWVKFRSTWAAAVRLPPSDQPARRVGDDRNASGCPWRGSRVRFAFWRGRIEMRAGRGDQIETRQDAVGQVERLDTLKRVSCVRSVIQAIDLIDLTREAVCIEAVSDRQSPACGPWSQCICSRLPWPPAPFVRWSRRI